MQPNTFTPQTPADPAHPAAPVVVDMSAPQGFMPAGSPMVPGQAYATMPAAVQYAAPAAASSVGRKLVKLAVVAVVAIGVFAGGYYTNNAVTNASQANATVAGRAFVAALNTGDSTKAYALTSSAMHTRQTEKQFTASLGDLKASAPKYGNQSTLFADGQATYVMVEDGLPETSAGITTGTFTIVLTKDGPLHWKVDSASVE